MEDVQDVRNWLVDFADYEEEEVDRMKDQELLESWLAAKGVFNITDELLEVISAIYDIDL